MNITLNGKEESIDKESISIEELLTLQKVQSPDMVSVEYNGSILDRDDFSTTSLSDGDKVEFLFFMGGGC